MNFPRNCPSNSKALFRQSILAPITGALVLSFVFSSSASAATDLASIRETLGFDSTGEYFLSSDIENLSFINDNDGNTDSMFTSFSGTLNGNNYSISGLNTPLFGNLDKATVNHITLNTDSDGISVNGSAGVLAVSSNYLSPTDEKSTINNVKINGKINAAGDSIGGIIGNSANTDIDNSESNIVITYSSGIPHAVGGLVGLNSGGVISNSKSQGVINGYDSVGGIAGGNVGNGLIVNSRSEATVTGVANIGGLVGGNGGGSGVSSIVGSSFNGTVSGYQSVGGIAGTNSGGISRSVSSGTVTATDYSAGGLVGYNLGGSIDSSDSNVNVTAPLRAGGLVGSSDADSVISHSMAQGNVNGDSAVGGLVGRNYGDISNSIASGTVTGGTQVGGLVGINEYGSSSISNSIATGTVTGGGEVGGLIGYSFLSEITNSIAVGDVNGINDIGGLIGLSDSDSIIRTYAAGDVIGSGNRIGGLIGNAGGDNISGSTSSGDVSGANTVGGFIGYGASGTISNSGASGDVTGENNYVGGFIAGDAYNTITNSIASGNVTGVDYVGSFSGSTTTGHGYSPITNSTSMGAASSKGDYVGGFYGHVFPSPSETSFETSTQTEALTVINNGLEVAAWEINPNSSLNYPSLIVNMNTVTMISILNKNLIAPKWGNNKYINGGKPYLIALLSSGIYSDTTPDPTDGENSNGGSNANNRPISQEEIAKRESSGRKILESLKNDVKKIEVEDFKSAGIVGITDKSLPIVVELLAELEIQVFETSTVQKVVQIAGAISRIIATEQGRDVSFLDLRRVGVTEIEYSEVKDFSKFLSLIPADKKNSIREIQILVAEFKKTKAAADKTREAKKEATRIQREKNLQLILSMFKK